jgi:hypothetical protein
VFTVVGVSVAAILGLCIVLVGGIVALRLAIPRRQVASMSVDAASATGGQGTSASSDNAAREGKPGTREEETERQAEQKQEKAAAENAEAEQQGEAERRAKAAAEREKAAAEEAAAARHAEAAEQAEKERLQREEAEASAERKAQEIKEKEKQRRKEAFEKFAALPKTIPSDIPPSDSNSPPKPIVIGPLEGDCLDELRFELAVPKDEKDGPSKHGLTSPQGKS